MDHGVHYIWTVQSTQLTAKGAATRARIVEATADLVLARGVGGTTLDEVRAETATSKSQLFHYFPGGKHELVGAIVALQRERVLEAQRPEIDALDSWAAWGRWRDRVLAYYSSQPYGCPIGSLASELAAVEPDLAREVGEFFERWQGLLERGLASMKSAGKLRRGADPAKLAAATLASLQGGLLLRQSMGSDAPLEAALDGALAQLRSWAA
jgi:AcrR family transcriptional regulator